VRYNEKTRPVLRYSENSQNWIGNQYLDKTDFEIRFGTCFRGNVGLVFDDSQFCEVN
jgi:hypothetical protein